MVPNMAESGGFRFDERRSREKNARHPLHSRHLQGRGSASCRNQRCEKNRGEVPRLFGCGPTMSLNSLLPKLRTLIAVVAVLAGLLPVIGWIGGGFWFYDLFNHFQVQYVGFLAICVIVLLGLKAFRHAALAALFLTVPLIRVVPCYFPPVDQKSTTSAFRIVSFNVLVSNHRYEDAIRWVREIRPDIVYFTETTPKWSRALEDLKDTYPHVIDEGSGFAFYSKLPILSSGIVRCSDFGFPLLKARIRAARGEFTFFGAHPLPPVKWQWARALNQMMQDMAREVGRETGPVILAGDLNSSRWGHMIKPLYQVGLKDSSIGKAPGPTWMRMNPIFAIPIDHILFRGPGVGCSSFAIGPDLGSDHRPLVAEIGW